MIAKHIKTGGIGEKTALHHLIRHGFEHLESNFRSKTGEIDLILEKDDVVHFVEVKTVSRNIPRYSRAKAVPHGTYKPEDNVHRNKLRKVLNTIQIWLALNKYEGRWQLDVAAVEIDMISKRGKIRVISNVVVE